MDCKFRRPIWTDFETKLLINIVKEENLLQSIQEQRYYHQRIPLYAKICKKLEEVGYTRDPSQIATKLKALKREYVLALKRNEESPGTGTAECKFFNGIRSLFGKSDNTIESIENSTDRDHNYVDDNEPEMYFVAKPENRNEQSSSSSCPPSPDPLSLFQANVSRVRPEPSTSKRTLSRTLPDSPPKKRRHDDLDDLERIEEALMEKNHKWWNEQFDKQRDHERRLAKQFQNEMKGLFSSLNDTIRECIQTQSYMYSNTTSTSSVHPTEINDQLENTDEIENVKIVNIEINEERLE